MESGKNYHNGNRVNWYGYLQVKNFRFGRSKPQQDYYRNHQEYYHKQVRKFIFGKQFEHELSILRIVLIQ